MTVGLPCIGCGGRSVQLHHCVRVQELRAAAPNAAERTRWVVDHRNLVAVCVQCHADHHARVRPFALGVLPDSVFVFAVEKLGVGRAYNFLRRFYEGEEPRLDALLEDEGMAA